jgi:hypothetical protein
MGSFLVQLNRARKSKTIKWGFINFISSNFNAIYGLNPQKRDRIES